MVDTKKRPLALEDMGKITFERPPLAEVSFGIFFSPLKAFRTAHFGAFWSRVRPEFNQTADTAPVGDAYSSSSGIVAVPGWFPLPRVLFIHQGGDHLIQLQTNRFYFNWRRSQGATPYPRFDSLEPLFLGHVERFQKFLIEEAIGAMDVSGAELVYINQIPEGQGWSDVTQIGEIFPDLRWSPRTPPQGQSLGFAWHASFEDPVVRLEADIKLAPVQDGLPKTFLFELRAQSREKLTSVDAVRQWFSTANATIVSAFVDLTSVKMQKEVWRRVDA